MLESQLLEQIKIGQGLGRKRISNVRVCNRMIFQKSFSVSFLDFIGSERVGHALSLLSELMKIKSHEPKLK